MKIHLIGLATELGRVRIPMGDITRRFRIKPEIVTRKNGITALYAFDESQDVIDVAVRVCQRALQKLPKNKKVSGIFGASNFTGPTLMPSFTATVAHKLKLRDVVCDHVGLGCAGGIQALRNAYNQLAVDSYHGKTTYYLIICGDQLNRIIDPESLNTSVFFSDGCAALLLTNDIDMETGYGIEEVATMSLLNDDFGMLTIDNPFACRDQSKPLPWLEMKGKSVFDFAADMMVNVTKLIGPDSSRIKSGFLIPHQANLRLIEQITTKAGLTPERVYSNGVKTIGNLLNCSTFFGLDDVLRTGQLVESGSTDVFLLGFGAEQQVGIVWLKPVQPTEIICP